MNVRFVVGDYWPLHSLRRDQDECTEYSVLLRILHHSRLNERAGFAKDFGKAVGDHKTSLTIDHGGCRCRLVI